MGHSGVHSGLYWFGLNRRLYPAHTQPTAKAKDQHNTQLSADVHIVIDNLRRDRFLLHVHARVCLCVSVCLCVFLCVSVASVTVHCSTFLLNMEDDIPYNSLSL